MAALVAATCGQLPTTETRHVAAFNMFNVAAIEESPSTVGIADSAIYFTESLDEVKARLDLVESLGASDVRLLIPWIFIQTQDPAGATVDWQLDLDWVKLDQIVQEIDRRGMGILGVLQWAPDWATDGVTGVGHPTDVQDFADFAAAVATRYGKKISAYEVWNEPNAAFFWNPVDPAAYTEMLKATYTSLKAVDQDITVVGAVVGATQSWGDILMNPVDFVEAMFESGADGYFDALSFHPYNFTTKFSEGNDFDWRELTPLLQVQQIRALMDQHLDPGEQQLKIWISEYGLPTSVVSAQVQAEFMSDLITAWQSFSGAGPIFLYTTKDDPSAVGDERFFGIFDADGNVKDAAALAQLTKLIACLDGCSPTVPADPAEALTPLLQFIQQLISNVFSFVPNMMAALVSSVSNFIGSLLSGLTAALAGSPTTPLAGASLLAAASRVSEDSRVATVGGVDHTTSGVDGQPATESVIAYEITNVPAVADAVVESAVIETAVLAEPALGGAVLEDTVADEVIINPAVEDDAVTDPIVVEETVVDETVVDENVVDETVVDETVDASSEGVAASAASAETGGRATAASERLDDTVSQAGAKPANGKRDNTPKIAAQPRDEEMDGPAGLVQRQPAEVSAATDTAEPS